MMLERGAHPKWAKNISLENETVDMRKDSDPFGGSMSRKEAKRSTRYG
jgi:hypothetical protein